MTTTVPPMAPWTDHRWTSPDGLSLHYRDYAGRTDRPPILCVPGLTRNARDFAGLADRLAGEWRLILVELRGRGESDRARDAASYAPLVYLQDLAALFEQLGVPRVVLFGTSLGGLMAMLIAATQPQRLAGVLLNDIGPVIEEAGLARIRDYVGARGAWPSWLHAARALAESQAVAFPDYAIEDWLAMAKRLFRVGPGGRIVHDYDAAIAEPFRAPPPEGPAPDMWPALEAMVGIPTLMVRGAISDVLSESTAAEMARRLPLMERVTVPRVGHVPTLLEPEAAAGIDRLLARVAAA